jgi:large subunit ribosomal protein L11
MAEIKALVEAANASAGPPLGPQLGPLGVNIGQVVSEINEKTQEFEGMEVPVTVIVDEETKDFEIEVGTPPTSAMIKEETELDTLSPHPKEEKVANMLIEQCIKIAKAKMPDLNSPTMKSAVKQVVGSCASSGVLVEDKEPEEVIKEIDEGKYDEEIESEKTELTEEEKEELRKEREELEEKREEMEEEWREKAEEMLKQMEAETEEGEELSRSEKVEKLKGEDIPYEIIVEFLPEEEEEEEDEEGEEETEEVFEEEEEEA